MSKEIWKDVPGFVGWYKVSNKGNILGLSRSSRVAKARGIPHKSIWRSIKLIKANKYGHLKFGMSKYSYPRRIQFIHRVVLETFIGPCPDGMEACHYDGDPTNNCLENLRWDTRKNNFKDCKRHGTRMLEKSPNSKLTNNDVLYIRSHPELTLIELSYRFGVHYSTIGYARQKKTWKEI